MKPFIQSTVDNVLNRMIEKGCNEPVDLVENFSLPVPSIVRSTSAPLTWLTGKVIYEILGVPAEDMEYLTETNAVRTNGSSTAAAAQNANT